MDWPKLLPFVVIGVLAAGALAAVAGPRLLAREKADPAIYFDLRNRALTASAEELGVSLPADDRTPYGVIMDWSVGDGTATLVAWNTGDTSLYLSSGGGFIGGYAIEAANRAAKDLVASSAGFNEQMQPATDLQGPGRGEVRFFLRTRAGVVSATASEKALWTGEHRLAPLFAGGQEVITAFRQSQESG